MKKIFFVIITIIAIVSLTFIFIGKNNLTRQEETLYKVGSLKIDLSNLEKYKSSDLGIQFQYKSGLRIVDYGNKIILTGIYAQSKNFDEAGITFRQHENNGNSSPRFWWWKNKFNEYGINSIFQLTKKEVQVNGQGYYIVASGGKWRGSPFVSAFTRCNNKICEVSSRMNKLYLDDENYYIALLTLDSYKENPEYADEMKNWKAYKNNKFGYEINYPDYYPITSSEPLGSQARDNDPYVNFGPFEIRALFCTFSSNDMSLEEYTERQALLEKNIKYINENGKENIAEMAIVSGLPKLTTYNYHGDYLKTAYIKRGKILYIISLSKIQPVRYDWLFDKIVASFKLLPLENESAFSNQEACGFKNAGGNFYKNDYVVQYLTGGLSYLSDQNRLPGIEAKKFKFLGGDFGKDDSLVYFQTRVIEGADPNSFRFISGNKASDKNNTYIEGIKASLWKNAPNHFQD